MRYILNNEGYIYDVSFGAIIECSLGTCTEYKGKVPSGYSTIEDWYAGEYERLNSWKIVDGNLVFDVARDYKLKILFDQEAEENRHVTRKEIGIKNTDETNPYADLFPSKESLGMYINYTDEEYGKIGNFSTERVEIRNIENKEDIDLIELEFIGKNFLPNTATSTSNNGIVYTQNIDKTFNVKGTSTGKSTLNLAGTDTSVRNVLTFKGGVQIDDDENDVHGFFTYDYFLFGLEEGMNLELYHYDGTDRTLIGIYKNNDVITFNEDTNVTQVILTIDSGITIDTLIKPMLCVDAGINVSQTPYLSMTKYLKKNLFDSELWYETLHNVKNEAMMKEIVNGIEYYKFYPNSIYNKEWMKGKFKENTQYTISFKGLKYDSSNPTATGFTFQYTDGTYTYVAITSDVEQEYELTSKAGKTVKYIGLYYQTNWYALVRDIQLEEGTTATEYEPYDKRNGQYYVDGVSTQIETPTPDNSSEIVNKYKAGEYKVPLNNKEYYITLDEDLRGLPNGVADRLWLDIENSTLELERKIGRTFLNGSENWMTYSTAKVEEGYVYNVAVQNAKQGYHKSLCSHFINYSLAWDVGDIGDYSDHPTLVNKYFVSDKTTLAEFKTWLSTNNVEVIYELATYTNTYIGYFYSEFEYEEYKNNTTLIDLAGNKFDEYDSIVLENNQARLVKDGAIIYVDENGNEIDTERETILLGYVSMPRTYTPFTNAYCHQRVDVHSFRYRDCRNIDAKKINLEGSLEIDKIVTNEFQVSGCKVYGEYVLFEGNTNTDILLKDAVTNYDYIEIFYCDNDKNYYGSQKIYSPNNKKTTLSLTPFFSNTNGFYSYIYNGGISISGNTITRTGSMYLQIHNQSVGTHNAGNYVHIYRVVGYRGGEVIVPVEPEEPIEPDTPIVVNNTKTISANGSRGHHKFTLEVDETSIVSNKSTIDYTFKMSAIQTGWNWNWSGQPNKLSYTITIGNNTYNGTIPVYDGRSTITLKSGSNIEIEHNADGTKAIPISFTVTDTTGVNYTCGNASVSATMTLTTIQKGE